MEIWLGNWTFVSTVPGPVLKESPVGECKAGSISCCTVNATSSAENGVPSENETPLRNLKVICFPSFESFHDCASSGSTACVCRFSRISTPPVKYRIDTDASSSTFSGSNVFGSECKQNRSSPPLCAAAVPSPPKQTRTNNRDRKSAPWKRVPRVNNVEGPTPNGMNEKFRRHVMRPPPLALKAQAETT